MRSFQGHRLRCVLLTTLSVWFCGLPVVGAGESDRFVATIGPAFKEHCHQCHGGEEETEGDIDLTDLNQDALLKNVDLVRGLIEVLDFEEMPPEDESDLEPALRRRLVSDLKAILKASVANQRGFDRAPIRRMNRFQYNNAVVDLFELRCIVFTLPERMMREHGDYFRPETGKMGDVVSVGSRPLGKSQLIEPRLGGVAAFPQDLRAEHGFDNRGDHLSLSPLLMESFLRLGDSITGSPDFVPRNVGVWNEFFAPPNENANLESEVARRLEWFLSRAFRHDVDASVIERYTAFVKRKLDGDSDFTTAMKSVAAVTLASPKFLYLYDRSADETADRSLSDFELASRLSFFLWGSIPDEELMRLAKDEKLHEPQTLTQQVDRMLRDRKIKRFCDSFPSQWLQLERIVSSIPDRKKFPGFYFSKYRDSMHMMLEPLLLFETILIENHPITQLIDSDFTYRSVLLEEAYGELASESGQSQKSRGNQVTTLKFHRVPVTDRRSGGVITNAAVMTMTSGPNRTQPITRGAWIAAVIFNNPPKPPPADVPPLAEVPSDDDENLTLRERLSQHRKRSDCKGCHEQIDPLGFALENYGPIGNWREHYENGRDVDVSGSLLRKYSFADVPEFKDAILLEKDRFTKAFAQHLLSFALARELSAADDLAIDEIVEATAAGDYRIQTLIKQVIMSKPFSGQAGPHPGIDES